MGDASFSRNTCGTAANDSGCADQSAEPVEPGGKTHWNQHARESNRAYPNHARNTDDGRDLSIVDRISDALPPDDFVSSFRCGHPIDAVLHLQSAGTETQSCGASVAEPGHRKPYAE